MLKAIWKGITWFFKQPDETSRKVRGKPMFSSPARTVNVGARIPVTHNAEGKRIATEQEAEIQNVYQSLVNLTESESHAIELAQSKRFGPLALTDNEVDYILNNADIVHNRAQVVKAINLALNVQYVQHVAAVQEITAKLEEHLAQDSDK